MTREFRMDYIQSVQERYLKATKQEKGRILDECIVSAKFGQGLISPKLWFPIARAS